LVHSGQRQMRLDNSIGINRWLRLTDVSEINPYCGCKLLKIYDL